MINTEVCIVGAGPGGCITAIALAKLNVTCVLVDKATFPRHKACGEIITSNCIRELAELDSRIFEDYQNANFNFDIAGNTFVAPNQYQLEVEYKSPANERLGLPHCFATSRYDFDNFLLQSVRKYYPQIQIIEDCHLKSFKTENNFSILSSSKVTIKSRLAIFANGAGNVLTKRTTKAKKRPSHEAIGIRAYYKNVLPNDQPELAEFYFFQKKYMPFGVYITPLADGLVNINTWIRKDFVAKNNINIRKLMTEFIESRPKLKARFKDAELVGKINGASLELGSRWWKVSGNHYLLVGDAAGLIDATNANGIGHAMISGRMSADFVKQSLESNDFSEQFLSQYDKALRKRMNNALKLSRMVSPFFKMPFFPAFSTWMINYWMQKSTDSQLLVKLMYSKNAAKDFINPKHYFKMLFK